MITCDNMNYSTKFCAIIVIVLALINGIHCQACSSPDITQVEFEFGILNPNLIGADHRGTIIEYSMASTTGISNRSNTNMDNLYIDAEFNQTTNVLRIFTTSEFENYEYEQTSTDIALNLLLTCTVNTRQLIFTQRLSEANNHSPEFLLPLYEFQIMLPLPTGFDLTWFQEISASDFDLRNNAITFSSPDSGEYITVGTSERIGLDQKTYYPTLILTQQLLTIEGNALEFTIIGTDSGTPPRQGQTTVRITTNPTAAYIPQPQFEHPLYHGRINNEFRLELEQIEIVLETFSQEIGFGFDGGDNNLFRLTNEENIITITLTTDPLTEEMLEGRTQLFTTIVAQRASSVQSGSTVILIDLPPKSPPIIPRFLKSSYRGSLSEDRTSLTLAEAILIDETTFTDDVTLSLEGDDSELFSISRNGSTILVSLSRELTPNDLNEKIVLVCTIIAGGQTNTNDTTAAATTLIIDIPPLPEIISPIFEKSLYRGLINENRLLTIENIILNIDTFTEDAVFILDGDDSEFLTIASIDNVISLNLSSDITENDLSDKTILLASIVAYRNGSEENRLLNGTAHLIIDIAKIEVPSPALMPEFDQLLYLGKIDEDRLLTHNEITLNVSSFPDDIIFTLEGDGHQYFTISFNENLVTISLTNPLTENDLFDISWFVLSIIATRNTNNNTNNNTENINDISNAVLLIEVTQYVDHDSLLQPTFENHIYRGIVNSNLTLIMENELILLPNTFTENVNIQLVGDDSDLFSITRVDNIISLNLSRELTIEEMVNKTILITTIIARQGGSSINGSATILVEIPPSDENNLPPNFEELIYRGIIDVNRSLIISEIILNPDTFNSDIRFSLEGDERELFVITNIEHVVTINLAEPLTELDLFEKRVIVLTIHAINSNQLSGSAVLIIEVTPLEESENPEILPPQFENLIHRGLIDTNRSLIINETIILLIDTYSEDVIFQLEGADSDLFSIINNENIISVNLSRELTNDDLNNKTFLMTTIIATNVQSLRMGSTVLIFEIETINIILPSFENITYKGQLNENRSLILDNIILEAEFWTDDIVFSLEGDDGQLFSLANDINIITITLLRPLTDDDLLGKSFLLLNIVASSSVYMRNAVTTVIIDIPSIEFDFNAIPLFDQLIYRGNLSMTNTSSYDHFEIDRIILRNDDINENDDLEILLVGEDNEFFIATNVENVITISLARELTEIDLEGKTSVVITIIAIKTNAVANGTATIIIDILHPDQPIILLPTFERSVYNGAINESGTLTFNETILLIEETYFADEIEFELVGGDASLFRVNNNLNIVTISLARELTESDLEGKLFLITELFANRQSIGSNSTILIIELPEKLPEIIPRFERPTYRGEIDENRALSFDEQIQIIDTTYTTDVTFELEGGDHLLFNAVSIDNIVTIELARQLEDEDIDGRSYFMTVLTAKRPIESGGGNDNTVLLVNIPVTTERPPIAVPAFSKPMYRGEINADHEFIIETISLIVNTYSPGLNFRLEGDDSSYFSIVRNDEHVIIISLQSPINEPEELLEKEFLTFDIVASHTEAGLDRASILVSLPEKICPVDYTPEFENKNYHFWLKNDFIGGIGSVRAAVALNDSAVIEYQFSSTNEYLNQRIIVNEQLGTITLSQTLLPNEYNFEIIATANEILATTNVQLTVEELIVCPEPEINGTSFVEHSLLVKYISENVVEEIMPSTIGDCTFIIQRITPPNIDEYIRIVPETNMITAFNLNREDSIFDDMDVPQIQITLRLICDPDELQTFGQEQLMITNDSDIQTVNTSRMLTPLSNAARYINPVSEDGRFYVLTNSIPYSAYTTILTVIIQDENDNEPVFLQPLVTEMLFGYPNPEVAEQLMPSYVMQAIAIDFDAGINAQIRYSLSNTQNFQIHGTSGIITPIRDAFKLIAEESITLSATDRNGANDGHRTDTIIRIRRLDESFITVVTIQEEELDDLNDILDGIYDDVGIYLRCLHSAIISLAGNTEIINNNNFMSSERKSIGTRIAGQTNALRMFVYAIDQNDQFIHTNTVQERLSTLNYNVYNLSSVSYEKSSYVVPQPSEIIGESDGQMELILIILAAVLGGLLLLLGLGTFLMWWYKIRPYEYQEMEEDVSVSSQQVLRTKSDNGFQNQPQETSPVMKINRFDVEQRDSMVINGTTDKESNDHDEQNSKFPRSLNDLLDENKNGTVYNSYGGTMAVNQQVNYNGRSTSAAAAAAATATPSVAKTVPVTTPPEPRKSGVRFNEMVERIDIEVEPADIARNDDEDNINNNNSDRRS